MISSRFEALVKRVQSEDTSIPVMVTLSYDGDNDPFAVEAVFEVHEEEDRIWYFSRDLLEKGVTSLTPYGKGDVKFRYFPLQGVLMMCLWSTDGHVDIALPLPRVIQFLDDTSERAEAEQDCTALVDDFLKEVFEA